MRNRWVLNGSSMNGVDLEVELLLAVVVVSVVNGGGGGVDWENEDLK